METPPNKQLEKRDIFMSLPGSESLSDEAQIAVYELDTFLHTVYDPFNDYVDWRGWMLGVCGRVLELSNKFSNYALAIRHLLAQSVRNIALYDTRQAAPKGYLIAKLAKTHPLLNSAEVPKNGIAYVEGWDGVYLKRRARLIAFIQFYEFLTQPDSCSTPIETTAVKLPYQWLDYINSFDLGFRKEMWGAASLWESHTHNSPVIAQQAPTPLDTSAPNAPRPEQVAKISFRPGFTVEDADSLAREIGLIDESANYTGLLGVAPGRLCGFYWQLKVAEKVGGSLELLRDFFALRYLKKPIKSKPDTSSQVANDMFTDVERILKRPFSTKNPG